MKNPRDDIRKIVEWHATCITEGEGQFPCNFIPLIVGPSGSGKTYTVVESVNEWTISYSNGFEDSIPFIYIDATQLTAEGWDGLTLSECLYDGCNGDVDLLEKAIIYVDEIDKLSMNMPGNAGGHHKNIQSNLLSWLDKSSDKALSIKQGGKYSHIPVSVAQATWIFSGAFEPLFQAKSIDNKSMGFNADVSQNNKVNYNQAIAWQDIMKAGLMPELVNRMNVLIQTYEYSDKQLEEIIKGSYDKKFIEKILGVKVPNAKVLRETKKFKAGARGINKALYQEALEKYQLKE